MRLLLLRKKFYVKFAELSGKGGWLTIGNLFKIKRMLGLDTSLPNRSLYVEATK
jgi:hypothetical protein